MVLSEGKAVTKSVAEFTVMGKSPRHLDAREKVTGRVQYAGDIRIPGMLYARILRPPAHGARLKSVDTAPAAKMPGVIVVNEGGLVAVLHPEPEIAAKALDVVKADWDVPAPAVNDTKIYDHLLKIFTQARESQIDIMAAKAKLDPLEFRLKNTTDKRMRSVLESAAKKFGSKKAALPSGRGYGIGCGIDSETYVALILEISLDKVSGLVKVKRVVAAPEMGVVINPFLTNGRS